MRGIKTDIKEYKITYEGSNPRCTLKKGQSKIVHDLTQSEIETLKKYDFIVNRMN